MIVIYAEKYSLGRTIAEALGAYKKTVNPKEPSIAHWSLNLNGEEAILCHGAGHLCGLAPAEDYNESYKFWSFDNYPIIPEHFITRVKDNNYSRLAYDYVKQFFDKADLIINATDADREGELIFAYLYEVLHCTVPYKRVWITDLTPFKIRKAFAELRPAKDMKPLENAGRIRSATDWLVGINTSVAATLKFGGTDNVFACGRVKMPTLAMIVKREREIRNYVKKPFYKIVANIEATDGAKFTAEAADKYDTETAAKAVIDEIKLNTAKAIKVEVLQKQTAAPLLYNTTHLLADLSKCTDLTIDMLTKLVQSLYENRLITYPRTSSEHLTDAMKDETVKIIKLLFEMPEFAKYAIPVDNFAPCTRRHYDDSKVDSHTAITPTALVPNDLSGMSENERKAYTLLALSIIRTVYPKAVTENVKAVFQIDNQLFTATGTNIISPGWFAVDATPKVIGLPEIVKDNDYKVIGFDVKEGQNEPPKYYTDATLLTAMELAGDNIEDEQTRNLIKLEKRGLGTAATRQGIIKELYEKGYIARRTKKNGNMIKGIMPTEKGMYIIDALEKTVPDMLSVDMTSDMEMELDKIARGKSDGNDFLNNYKKLVAKWVELIKNSDTSAMAGNTLICPLCSKPLIKKKVGWCCTGYSKDNPDSCRYVTVELQAQKQKGEKYICEGFSSEHIPELIERGITKKYVNMIAVNGDGVMSRYAFCRSVSDKSTYRVDLPGSDKKYSFSLIGTNKNKLYVFESVIDMLSYASFYAIRNGQDSWQELTMISLGGKSDVALDEFLQNNPITEITLCLDNDEAGRHASAQLSDKYALKGYTISNDIPLNKDFNDDLKAFRALEEKSTIQTTTKPLRR